MKTQNQNFKLMILSVVTLLSAMAHAGPKEEVIQAAQDLATVTADLSDEARLHCGCQNTARVLADMSEVAGNLQVEAQFGSKADAIKEFKKLYKLAIEIRQFVKHVPSASFKLKVRLGYLVPINQMGKILIPGFVVVKELITDQYGNVIPPTEEQTAKLQDMSLDANASAVENAEADSGADGF